MPEQPERTQRLSRQLLSREEVYARVARFWHVPPLLPLDAVALALIERMMEHLAPRSGRPGAGLLDSDGATARLRAVEGFALAVPHVFLRAGFPAPLLRTDGELRVSDQSLLAMDAALVAWTRAVEAAGRDAAPRLVLARKLLAGLVARLLPAVDHTRMMQAVGRAARKMGAEKEDIAQEIAAWRTPKRMLCRDETGAYGLRYDWRDIRDQFRDRASRALVGALRHELGRPLEPVRAADGTPSATTDEEQDRLAALDALEAVEARRQLPTRWRVLGAVREHLLALLSGQVSLRQLADETSLDYRALRRAYRAEREAVARALRA